VGLDPGGPVLGGLLLLKAPEPPVGFLEFPQCIEDGLRHGAPSAE